MPINKNIKGIKAVMQTFGWIGGIKRDQSYIFVLRVHADSNCTLMLHKKNVLNNLYLRYTVI